MNKMKIATIIAATLAMGTLAGCFDKKEAEKAAKTSETVVN